jgi:hypothetical protein
LAELRGITPDTFETQVWPEAALDLEGLQKRLSKILWSLV